MNFLKHLLDTHSDLFEFAGGDQKIEIFGISPLEKANLNNGIFVSKATDLEIALQKQSAIIFLHQSLKDAAQKLLQAGNKAVVICKQTQIGMAIVLKHFDHKAKMRTYPEGISPKSIIHPSVKIGQRVSIAPFVQIGPDVILEDDVVIGPNCVIEGGCHIGKGTLLHAQVYLGSHSEIGAHCILQPFACIASDGYGYAPTSQGILKIAQLGKVVIEDHVEIGANTCVDRATLDETRIGFGTKLDNLVHIAHNCKIGRYCFITAGFATAGSTVIDDFFICGGTCAVADHVYIAKNVTLAGATVVTSDITESGAYGGNPVQPMQDYLKTRSSLSSLPELRKQVKKIIKKLGLESQT